MNTYNSKIILTSNYLLFLGENKKTKKQKKKSGWAARKKILKLCMARLLHVWMWIKKKPINSKLGFTTLHFY